MTKVRRKLCSAVLTSRGGTSNMKKHSEIVSIQTDYSMSSGDKNDSISRSTIEQSFSPHFKEMDDALTLMQVTDFKPFSMIDDKI